MEFSISTFGIPEVKGVDYLPSPEDLIYWQLKKERVYFIDYEIDEDYRLIQLSKELIRLNMEEASIEEPEPVFLYIHSYGGDIEQAEYFCDLVEASHVPIVTIATGAAMSAGLLIFLAGKRKYVFEHSQILIHEGTAGFSGTPEEIAAAQESYKKQVEGMGEYIMSHTRIDKKLFNKYRNKQWYLSGEQLIELGIADKIIERFEDIQ